MVRAVFLCTVNYLKRAVIFKSERGYFKMDLRTPPDDITEAVFQMMLIGMREIENLKPNALKVFVD